MIKLRAKANLLLLVVLVSGCAPIAPEWRALRDSPAPAASITVPVKYGGEVLERPCDLYIPANEVEGQTIRCGFVRVPWDRSEPADATTDLAFVILKATGDHPRPDAIIHVAGGPGAGSTLRDAGLEFIKRYAPLREERDVILYDQRGIGNSLPFFACGYPDEAAAAAAATALEQRLGRAPTAAESQSASCEQEWAARGFPVDAISTRNSAADLVDLLAALDYPAYDLYGVSYGTRLLMALMHFFPEEARVHSIVLDSPYPLPEDQVNDLAASSALQYPTLLDQLFAACAQDEPCNGAYPELGARYAALVARLAAAPMKLPDGSNFTAEDLQRSIFPFTPAIGFVPYMPRLIAELEAGDTSTLAALQSNAIPGSHHLTALGVEHPRVGELIDAYLTCTTDAPDDSSWQAYAQRLLGLWDAAPADVVAFLTATCLDGSGATASALVQELPAGVFNSIIMRFAPEQTPGVNMMLNGKLRCTEQVPFAPEPQAVMERLRAVDLPEFFVQETAAGIAAFRDGCEGWSNARAAPAPSTYGNYPVLILSGDFDATTPPAFAQIAAAQLPQASLIAVPNATHSILGNYGDCVTGITRQFLGGPTQPVDTACTAAMRIPWSMPDEPLPGAATGGAAGQAATPAAAPDAWEDADCIGLTGFSSFEEVLGAMSRCGYLVVPKDHFDPANTNTLKVAIMVVDEVREPQLPVFYLHGGPGGGVIGGEFAAARAMVFQAVDR